MDMETDGRLSLPYRYSLLVEVPNTGLAYIILYFGLFLLIYDNTDHVDAKTEGKKKTFQYLSTSLSYKRSLRQGVSKLGAGGPMSCRVKLSSISSKNLISWFRCV